MCKEISQQRSSRTPCGWLKIWSQKKKLCTLLAPTADSSGVMDTRLEVEVSSAVDSKKVRAERADGAG